jgi:hypothetical protein
VSDCAGLFTPPRSVICPAPALQNAHANASPCDECASSRGVGRGIVIKTKCVRAQCQLCWHRRCTCRSQRMHAARRSSSIERNRCGTSPSLSPRKSTGDDALRRLARRWTNVELTVWWDMMATPCALASTGERSWRRAMRSARNTRTSSDGSIVCVARGVSVPLRLAGRRHWRAVVMVCRVFQRSWPS